MQGPHRMSASWDVSWSFLLGSGDTTMGKALTQPWGLVCTASHKWVHVTGRWPWALPTENITF